MISYTIVVLLLVSVVASEWCYWNDACSYQLFSSKTPYDTVRGDIRDILDQDECSAVSVWSLNRHGNRNPGTSATVDMHDVANLKDEIVTHGRINGELCAQDIEDFRNWSWNDTLNVAASDLTGTGYQELYNIAKRLRERFPYLLEGATEDDFYFRTTSEQRTITSCLAFVHGWSEGTNLNILVDGPWDRDEIIRPYANCDRYQQEVRDGQVLAKHMADYFASPEFLEVMRNIQRRTGLDTTLDSDQVYSMFDLCRFYRSWEPNLKSPWCSVFTNKDLVVLEYYDDIRHYYRNGYGSWVNVNLGRQALKDLYERFEAAYEGRGKKLVAYFTHDTMIEMLISAMDLYKDDFALEGGMREPNRLWRTSYIGSFSANIQAVLNRCSTPSGSTHRVQIFFNENVTDLCPQEGCTWEQFQGLFQKFSNTNLDFCRMDYEGPEVVSPENTELFEETLESAVPDAASMTSLAIWTLLAGLGVLHVYLR